MIYFTYILASQKRGTLYIGVTGNLPQRIWQHKTGAVEGFTKTYNVHRLVYAEAYEDVRDAIQREKHLKKWNRQWRIDLIESANPDWREISAHT